MIHQSLFYLFGVLAVRIPRIFMILCVICVNYLIQSPLPRNNPAIRRGDKKYQKILAIQTQNTRKQGTRPRFACGPFQDILRRSRPCPAWPPVPRCHRVFGSTCRDPTVGPPPCNATNAERDHFGSWNHVTQSPDYVLFHLL